MELFIFLGTLFFFLAFGIPICLVLVLCAMVLMWHSGMWDAMIIPGSMLDGANNYPLMAIPFFVFAGEIMAAGGLSKRVVQLAQLMIGRVRGGLGYAAVVASIIFAGLMGSSVGTVLYVVCGIGNIKITQLIRNLVPFILVEVVMLFLLLFFPKLSLIPLDWLMGGK